jgi:hypothetical protein
MPGRLDRRTYLPRWKYLRSDRRVIVSRSAAARAISPAIWAVSTGAMADESATDSAFRLVSRACTPADGDGLGVADGEIAGNRPAAFPAPMSELDSPFRLGRGPTGSALRDGVVVADFVGEGDADADVTVTVEAAEVAVVTMLAVAVSFTELTEVALDETGTCAPRSTAFWSVTELTVQVAVFSPLAQPLVNVGFWLAGSVTMVTDTSVAEPFLAETATT